MDLSIIIVNWNTRDLLAQCLQSVYNTVHDLDLEVFVVDNGSTDGSQMMLREKFPQVRVIQNEHNVGLSRASNQGVEATTGRYVLLLNNDTLVNGPSLEAMVEFMDATPDAAAVGGRLLNPDGSFQAGYARFPSLWQEFLVATRLGELLWRGYPSHDDNRGAKSVDWLSSACLLLRRAALIRVGLLDEEYFIYGDETDLQYRLKRAGWKVYYLPAVTTIHYGGRSLDRWRRRRMVYRGRMLFYKKNYGRWRTTALRVMLGILSLIKLLMWGIVLPLPRWRRQAKLEIGSNRDILRLCWELQ